MCVSTVNPYSIFVLGVMPRFELRNLTKMKDTIETIGWNTNVPNVPYMYYTFCKYRIYEIIMLYFSGVNWHLWLIYQLNT